MRCPLCGGRMREMRKHGVDMDVCLDCKGIWLDHGELAKIMQTCMREGAAPDAMPSQAGNGPPRESWLTTMNEVFGGGV